MSDRIDTAASATPESCNWTVGGMDCASCAGKISGAVSRIPGVSDVKVSVMTESLTATLSGGDATKSALEKQVKALGYTIKESAPKATTAPRLGGCCDHDHGKHDHDHTGHDHSDHDHSAATKGPDPAKSSADQGHGMPGHVHEEVPAGVSWFETGKGRLVIVTAALLAAAWAVKLLAGEDLAKWAFIAACLIGLAPVARRAFAAARAGMVFTIEMLMTIAAIGALFINAAEEAALVVFLFAVGEVLEGVAATRARASIKALGDLVPTRALVIGDTGATRDADAATLAVGQTVLVRPGDRIPADGAIIEGMSSIDEAPVTGESVPKSKGIGEDVFAGSINIDAALKIRVTRAAADNTIARIIRLVEEAQEAKAPTERFIDQFSRIYMPAIVGIALLVLLVPPLLFGGEWSTWIYRSLALLLIGCPCALVISVPASIASSLSAGAKRGLLMKGGVVMENAARTQIVAFDKTGTLTVGRPAVTDVVAIAGTEAEMISVAAGIEEGSSHPLAEAILAYAKAKSIASRPAAGSRAIAGKGVIANVECKPAYVSSPRHAAELGVWIDDATKVAEGLEKSGKTVVAITHGDRLLGLIAMRDEPREDAKTAIAELKDLGIRSIMLTGDNARTGAAIAGHLGMEYRAELMPDDKVAEIRKLAATDGIVMVGDGINDAPALAAATVGVAMGSGTQVALEAADAALLRSRVTDVPRMIRLARATMGNIRTNIAVALGLKAVFLVTSILGYTGLWVAILADTGATVLVTLNALRLLAYNPDAKA